MGQNTLLCPGDAQRSQNSESGIGDQQIPSKFSGRGDRAKTCTRQWERAQLGPFVLTRPESATQGQIHLFQVPHLTPSSSSNPMSFMRGSPTKCDGSHKSSHIPSIMPFPVPLFSAGGAMQLLRVCLIFSVRKLSHPSPRSDCFQGAERCPLMSPRSGATGAGHSKRQPLVFQRSCTAPGSRGTLVGVWG